MSKTDEIRIKVSKEEKVKIRKRAELAGMKIAPFARYLLLNSRIKIEVSENDG